MPTVHGILKAQNSKLLQKDSTVSFIIECYIAFTFCVCLQVSLGVLFPYNLNMHLLTLLKLQSEAKTFQFITDLKQTCYSCRSVTQFLNKWKKGISNVKQQ